LRGKLAAREMNLLLVAAKLLMLSSEDHIIGFRAAFKILRRDLLPLQRPNELNLQYYKVR